MKYESQRIAMAELEGCKYCRISGLFTKYGKVLDDEREPAYDTLDDCQRVFKGLNIEQKLEAHKILLIELQDSEQFKETGYCSSFEATPEQWRTAILKSAGKWEES